MKTLEWVNFLNEMKLQNKKVYTLAEIANIDNTTIKSAKTILQRLKKNKILLNAYKNIWAVPEVTTYDIAPFFDPGCYCSMETALFHYNMIKQSPQIFHFISTRLSKRRNTRLGTIYFHKIRKNLYFGFNNYMADPEKAILDYLYFCLKDGRKPFVDYDIAGLDMLNRERLQGYSNQFPKTVRRYSDKLLANP